MITGKMCIIPTVWAKYLLLRFILNKKTIKSFKKPAYSL